MNFSIDDFKGCLGSFASGVTIVTTTDSEQMPCGVTISSFSSLSLNPPLVAFNLKKESQFHKKILSANNFVVNILQEEQKDLSHQFAKNPSLRLNGVKYKEAINGCPIIDNVLSYIECLKENIYDGGDHNIIIGRVINLKKFTGRKPLIYYQGGYYNIG